MIVVALAGGLFLRGKNTYNSLITLSEWVNGARAEVENKYQRRFDLIPNLVKTVQGYTKHEKETLQAVVEARAKATSTTVNLNDEKSLAAFQANQTQLKSALSRLLVSVEAYPELKADKTFEKMMAELEGSENRISVARGRFNSTVQNYNTIVRRFPTNLFAKMFNFAPKAMFQAEKGAEKAPEVNFDK